MCACANSFFKSFPQTRNQQKRSFLKHFLQKACTFRKLLVFLRSVDKTNGSTPRGSTEESTTL